MLQASLYLVAVGITIGKSKVILKEGEGRQYYGECQRNKEINAGLTLDHRYAVRIDIIQLVRTSLWGTQHAFA